MAQAYMGISSAGLLVHDVILYSSAWKDGKINTCAVVLMDIVDLWITHF
jgi:hypothetical protein